MLGNSSLFALQSSAKRELLPSAQVKGIKIQFSESKKVGNFYHVTELKVIEEKNGKVIDQFPELIWGNSVIQTNEDSFTWYRNSGEGSEVSVTYSVNANGEVIKKGKCNMFDDPYGHNLYVKTLPQLEDKTADWEFTISRLKKLAENGNKEAFDFFMSPSLMQKKYEKYNDGAASFKPAREVLRFMNDSAGCQWKKANNQ